MLKLMVEWFTVWSIPVTIGIMLLIAFTIFKSCDLKKTCLTKYTVDECNKLEE